MQEIGPHHYYFLTCLRISTVHPIEKCSAVIAQYTLPSQRGILTRVARSTLRSTWSWLSCLLDRRYSWNSQSVRTHFSLVLSDGCGFVLKRQRCLTATWESSCHGPGKMPTLAPQVQKEQGQFSSGCRVAPEQHFILSKIIQGSWEFSNPVNMWSVDLEKANDSVPLGILWEVLQEYWVQGLC